MNEEWRFKTGSSALQAMTSCPSCYVSITLAENSNGWRDSFMRTNPANVLNINFSCLVIARKINIFMF